VRDSCEKEKEVETVALYRIVAGTGAKSSRAACHAGIWLIVPPWASGKKAR
jgi:hypothetical protein